MRRTRTAAAVLAAAACAALLAGCAPTRPTPRTSYTRVPTATPTEPALSTLVNPSGVMGGNINGAVAASVYPVEVLKATAGCSCSLKGGGSELFPKGAYVLLLRVDLRSASDTEQLDAKGMTFDGTKYAGRPDLAVLDTRDGPEAAATAGLPWLPAGASSGTAQWALPTRNGAAESVSVAAAYYVPAGERELDLKVAVPGHDTLTVQAAIPGPLQDAASAQYAGTAAG